MTQEAKTKLVREYERLRKLAQELSDQADRVDQLLAATCAMPDQVAGSFRIPDAGLTAIIEGMIPTIREAIRAELKATRPLDEAWYEPSEVAAMSCGKVSSRTVRNWVRWGQIDGESDGRQVRIYQDTVEELRENKWRPLRQPDPSKMPASARMFRSLPSKSDQSQ